MSSCPLVAAIALFLVHCTTTETVKIADTQKPLHAELLIRKMRTKPCITLYRGGSCSYQEAAIVLHRGLRRREFRYGCVIGKAGLPQGQIETNASAGGDRIAFRCGKKEGWRVLYVGSEDRSFLDCRKYDNTVDFGWASAPPLRAAAPDMIRACGGSLAPLAAEIRSIAGESAVTDLLIATVSVAARRRVSMDHLQAWDDEYRSLPPGEKQRLVPVFRTAILGESTVLALERAVRYADLSDPIYLPALKARMQRIVDALPHYETDASADMILRMIARTEPQEAARLGCLELEREMKRGAIVYLPGALLAVAHVGYRCPAVLNTLGKAQCDAAYYCGAGQTRHVCEAHELSAEIQRALAGPAGNLTPNLRDRALLSAARAVDGSEGILRLWHARHSYTIDQPAEPDCKQLYILGKKGVPCHCFDELPQSACSTMHISTTCTYKVDDAARKITGVVSP